VLNQLPFWKDTAALRIPRSYFQHNPLDNEERIPPTDTQPPLSDFIRSVTEEAARCNEHSESEAVWSYRIYQRVLGWVLQARKKHKLFDLEIYPTYVYTSHDTRS
jgi:hypothetical protein